MRAVICLLTLLSACTAAPPSQPGSVDLAMERAQNEALAFQEQGQLLRAYGPRWQASLSERGLEIDGEGPGLALVSWGREGQERSFEPAPPALGACTEALDPSGACIRRAERQDNTLTEWWTQSTEGLRQGFDLSERPAGEGPLLLRVALRGADAQVEANRLALTDSLSRRWTYSDARAWDAEGRDLPVTLALLDEDIVLRVDDRGAVWPIVVDPVLTTASNTYTGEGSSQYFGASLAGGDINGDGYDDLAVGAWYANSGKGRVYVYHGSSTGLPSSVSTKVDGASDDLYFGYSVDMGGDIDNDGYTDMIVGATGTKIGNGRLTVFYGSSSGLSGSNKTTIEGAGGYMGTSVAILPDTNGDGYDDAIGGAPVTGSNTKGFAYVYYGSVSGLSSSSPTLLWPGTNWDEFGASVAYAGDVNKDGYGDVVVGAPKDNYSTANGKAYVFHGSSSGVNSTPVTTITGSSYYKLGSAVAGAGDVNGDGYDDVLISAPNGGGSYTGQVTVHLGSSKGASSTAATTLLGGTYLGEFGGAVRGAGDVDSDGYSDIIVGEAGTDKAYLYSGSASGLSSTVTTTLTGGSSAGKFGQAVLGNLDINSDGYGDVVVGDMYYSSYTGQVTSFLGYADKDADGYYGGGGGSASTQDCDDDDATVHPGATDSPGDGLDSDCDDKEICYTDSDSDGARGAGTVASIDTDCDDSGEASLTDPEDCDDKDGSVSPSATEICDAADIDEDCDELADNEDPSASPSSKTTFYADEDGDGFGGDSVGSACDAANGQVLNNQDCDDNNEAISPDAAELCDGLDNNCDARTDEGCSTDTDRADDSDPQTDDSDPSTDDSGGDGGGDKADRDNSFWGCSSTTRPAPLLTLALAGLIMLRRRR